MQKLSNTKLIALISKLLVLLLIAKVISLGIWWYLPNEGVELHAKKSYLAPYQRVNFSNMLINSKVSASFTEQKSTKAYSINNLILKGLYGTRLYGFAIVAKKSSAKNTTILAIGEIYEGYTLKAIELNQVIFTKAGKEYLLKLEESEIKSSGTITRVNDTQSEELPQKEVTRAEIKSYSDNPSQIWKEISIAPLKRAGKIVGFKVNGVKKGSKMATLGLKKGDIMIRANNVELSSINEALKLYQNINKIDTLALTILRNNEEKEIIYEIR